MSSPLKWDVFVSSQIPAVTTDLPPGVTEMKWSPISSTLISGERDAVLVDTFITVEQNRALADWVAASGKNLTTIYATHGHGDHFFGVNTIQLRFPNARFVASREAISVMGGQLSPPVLEAFWKIRFPWRPWLALPVNRNEFGPLEFIRASLNSWSTRKWSTLGATERGRATIVP